MAFVNQGGVPKNATASGAIAASQCTIIGYHVNSTTGGTMVIRDGSTSSATAVTGTITPGVGFTAFPASFSSGAYVTIANTLDVTFFVQGG